MALLAVSHVGSTALLVVVPATFTIGRMAPRPSLHGREREGWGVEKGGEWRRVGSGEGWGEVRGMGSGEGWGEGMRGEEGEVRSGERDGERFER